MSLRILLLLLLGSTVADANAAEPVERARRPVDVVRIDDTFFVLNRTGSISVLRDGAVVEEIEVGGRLTDVVALADPQRLLVVDGSRHQLVELTESDGDWSVTGRHDVARHPRSVAVDGEKVAVSSYWSRRLTLLDLGDPKSVETVDLPFLGGRVATTPTGFVVAAAGTGRLGVVAGSPPRLVRTIDLPGHNVGGLFYDTKRNELLVTQQVLKGETSTTYENVFWGGVLKNVLQTIPLDLLAGKPSTDAPPRIDFLGFPSDAAGDPADVLVTPSGRTLVSIAGTDTLHFRDGPKSAFESFTTGRRPAGIGISADERTAYVCNTFDDSLTVLDLGKLEQAGSISLGPSPEPSLVERGESLFHDARVSLDGWYSCHSCHTNGHTSGQHVDNLGDGYFGDPKLTPTLLGVHDTQPWAWNGSSKTLEQQVKKSILKTMRGDAAREEDVAAIVAYMQSLTPPPSLAEARGDADRAAAARGRHVFETRGCVECHAGERLTTPTLHDVGLTDESGTTEFNPPSLRGVSQRDRFLHDGRAKSLREVFEKHGHPNDTKLPARELEDLLEYLQGR